MLTDRFQRPRTRALGFTLTCGLAVALGVLGTGCDEVIEEECFEQEGTLTQVTTDTLTVDHLYPAISPDGTRIVFLTDFYVEEAQERDEKELGQGDFVIIDTPAPDENRPPTNEIESVGNARRIDFDERSPERTTDEYGAIVTAFNAYKGEASWIDNDTFVGVMENSRFLARLFVWQVLPPNEFNDYVVQPMGVIEQDTLLERENEPVRRFRFHYRNPRVSPDGEWVAYSRYYYDPGPLLGEDDDVYEYPAVFAANLDDGRVIRVTNGSAREDQPTWSPDGNSIAFTGLGEAGQPEIYRVAFDPSNPADKRVPFAPFTDGRERLTFTADALQLPEWSVEPTWMRNGQIVFTSNRRAPCSPRRIRNIWIMNDDGSDQRALVVDEYDNARPFAANYVTNAVGVDDLIVFNSRRNRDEAFAGQKEDIWVLRGGF